MPQTGFDPTPLPTDGSISESVAAEAQLAGAAPSAPFAVAVGGEVVAVAPLATLAVAVALAFAVALVCAPVAPGVDPFAVETPPLHPATSNQTPSNAMTPTDFTDQLATRRWPT
jgi:hypothetical protein